MLVTALYTACFSRAKINKKLWPPTLKFSPSTLNALAPALVTGLMQHYFTFLEQNNAPNYCRRIMF